MIGDDGKPEMQRRWIWLPIELLALGSVIALLIFSSLSDGEGWKTALALAAGRISLEHLRGVPWARIGELVGQRNLAVTANTYTHVLTDEQELQYAELVAC